MPIIKQAIKRAKQAITRRSRNLQVKRAIKQDVTALHTAVAEGKDINEKLAAAYSEIDRAVKKGTLHKNTAGRRKSQLAATVAKAAAPVTAATEEAKTTKGAGKKASASTGKTAAKKASAAKKPAAKAAAAKAPAAKSSSEGPERASFLLGYNYGNDRPAQIRYHLHRSPARAHLHVPFDVGYF
jgi:small subunit ribosomal protein S20